MRSLLRTFAFSLLAITLLLGAATTSRAAVLPFSGELSIVINSLDPIVARGGGMSDAGTRDGNHLTSLALPAGAFSADQVLVPVTDTLAFPIAGLVATVSNRAANFNESVGGRLSGAMPLHGVAKVCLFGTCSAAVTNLSVPLSVVGNGGSAYVSGAVNLTIQGAPWTTGTAAIGTVTYRGGARGPASSASSTGQLGGQLNVVTPIFVSTNIAASAVIPVFGFLRLGFGSLDFPACDDGQDNDGDGLVDYPDDPGCGSNVDPTETDPHHICDDGIDNDGDGKTDYPADPGCLSIEDTSESRDLRCNVEMSSPFYVNGNPIVISSLRFSNFGSTPLAARVRLQLKLPPNVNYLVNAIDVGADGSFSLPAHFDHQLGPVTMFTLNAQTPLRGDFEWRCALEDPATGRVITEDRARFFLQ